MPSPPECGDVVTYRESGRAYKAFVFHVHSATCVNLVYVDAKAVDGYGNVRVERTSVQHASVAGEGNPSFVASNDELER